MIFTSRAAEDYDKMPYVGADGSRKSRYSRFAPQHLPRPEFEPTRDELPWKFYKEGHEHSALIQAATPYPVRHPGVWRWEPSDRNRNRILIDLRSYWAHIPKINLAAVSIWREVSPELEDWPDATPAEIEHARKVLTRLAALGGAS